MSTRPSRFRSGMQALWQTFLKKPWSAVGSIIAVGLMIALVVVIIGGYLWSWDWTGVTGQVVTAGQQYRSKKTLWDWLQLLIIPIALAIGGYLLNLALKRREREATADDQHEAALQGYIDKISELLLKENLRNFELKPEYEEVRKIARVRTLTVLQRLDAVRKFSVLLFLHESGLIDKGKCIVELDIANLQRADLRGIHLEEGQLRGAKMQRADLSFAYLSGTDLKDANLHGATLREADLRGAYLGGVDLTRANLTRAIVTNEQLEAARSLQDAIMPNGKKHS